MGTVEKNLTLKALGDIAFGALLLLALVHMIVPATVRMIETQTEGLIVLGMMLASTMLFFGGLAFVVRGIWRLWPYRRED
jgi:hypothetical protein